MPSVKSRYNVLKQIDNGITPATSLEEAEHRFGKEERVKGYRVKVQYQTVEEEENKARREAIAQVILQSLRRQKAQ